MQAYVRHNSVVVNATYGNRRSQVKRGALAERSRARRTIGHFQSLDGPRGLAAWRRYKGPLFRVDLRTPAIEFATSASVTATSLELPIAVRCV